MLAKRGFVSRIYSKKPKGRPMPERMRIANARKSGVRSEGLMGLYVRTIGLARALAYNMRRLVWLYGRSAPA